MEQELKLALARAADLPRLLSALPPARDTVRQENHYLVDPRGTTSAADVMVRLRIETGRTHSWAVLTLKRRLKSDDGVFLAWEEEGPVPLDQARAIARGDQPAMALDHENVGWLARELGVKSLDLQGTLLNIRHIVDLEGFCLEVDETHFPDGSIDAEVEVETENPEDARALVTRVAETAGVALQIQPLGKYSRYLARAGRT
jgi:uncharacterized protein YjbK